MPSMLEVVKISSPSIQQIVIATRFLKKELEIKEGKKFNFICPEGRLTQPNAVLRYLCQGTSLQANCNFTIQWYEWFNIELYPVLEELHQQTWGYKESNIDKFNYCIVELIKGLQVLNVHLKNKTFFIGDNLSAIDITIAVYLELPFKLLISAQNRHKLINLQRWYMYVRCTAPFMATYGKVFLYNGDQRQKKQQTQMLEQNNLVKEIKIEDGFNIDNFKRQYQNSQNKFEVVSKLLAQFPKQWSVWRIHYCKDVTEGKIDFQTANMAMGTLQRLEEMRKSAFGTIGVYGVPENYEIRGVMMWKGNEVASTWKNHSSFMYHEFDKLDPLNQIHQKIVKQYWLQQEKAEGLPMYDVKKLI